MKKGNAAAGLVIVLFITAIAVTYWTKDRKRTPSISPSAVSITVSPSPTVAPTPTPETDPQTGWKVYRNKKFGFEFKYPPELYEENGIIYPGKNQTDVFNYVISTLVYEEKANQNEPKIDNPLGTKKQVGHLLFSEIIEKLTIDGHKAIRLRNTVEAGSETDAFPTTSVVIDLDDKSVVSITHPVHAEDELKRLNTNFDQILSTFHFISVD